MCGLIEDNLQSLEIAPADYHVIPAEASDYLRRHVKKSELPFNMVFFDPPYATDYEVLLKFIGGNSAQILAVDAIVIVEHHKKKLLPGEIQALIRYRELKQGDSVLSFYKIEE
jgi:16S rRNA G966 N2-methylase RsmD